METCAAVVCGHVYLGDLFTFIQEVKTLGCAGSRKYLCIAEVSGHLIDGGKAGLLAPEAAETAIRLNPELSLPYAVLSLDASFDWPADFEHSLALFDEPLARNPKNTTVYLWRTIVYLDLGYFDRAERDARQCLEIDPAYEICRSFLALAVLFSGDTARALEIHEMALSHGFSGNIDPFLFLYNPARQTLDRDAPPEFRVVRKPDLPHPTFSEVRGNLVMRETSSGADLHGAGSLYGGDERRCPFSVLRSPRSREAVIGYQVIGCRFSRIALRCLCEPTPRSRYRWINIPPVAPRQPTTDRLRTPKSTENCLFGERRTENGS